MEEVQEKDLEIRYLGLTLLVSILTFPRTVSCSMKNKDPVTRITDIALVGTGGKPDSLEVAGHTRCKTVRGRGSC